MSLPTYQLNVLSVSTGQVVKVFDMASIYTLQYSRRLNDVGTLVAVLPSSLANYNLFDWDNFIEVYRTHPVTGDPVREETYLTRSKHRFREGSEERLVIGGVSLNQLLMRRIINPDDDPAAVDGYSTKSGPADTVMREYVLEQAGLSASAARQIAGLSVGLVNAIGTPTAKSYRYQNLFNCLQELAYEAGIDFYIERGALNALNMTIGTIGGDKTKVANSPFTPWVGLNPDRSNLLDPSLKMDRTEEENYVYALGQGQGEQRLVYESNSTAINLSPLNRCEFVKDARNIDKVDTDGLISAAITALNERRIVTEFTFSASTADAGSIYRQNWDIGDKVTATWDDVTEDVRITGVTIALNESNEQIDVTVGDQYNGGLA